MFLSICNLSTLCTKLAYIKIQYAISVKFGFNFKGYKKYLLHFETQMFHMEIQNKGASWCL